MWFPIFFVVLHYNIKTIRIMGTKLSAEQIEQHTIDNPNKGFDQCSYCNGIEKYDNTPMKYQGKGLFQKLAETICGTEIEPSGFKNI